MTMMARRPIFSLRGGRFLVAGLGFACAAATFRLSAAWMPVRASDLQQGKGRLVRFTDRDGEFIGAVLADGDRACQPVKLAQVSPWVVRAFVAAEDKRFFRHKGVDWLALGRALVRNVRARRIVSGGSTITMQLARSLHPKARTMVNKLHEMHTAWRLEAGMTKRQILEAYLNRVPMGGNLVGVGVAARVFFDTSADRVTLPQAALLAAIPQNPLGNDPRLHRKTAEARRAYVLRCMEKAGYLSHERAEMARKVNLHLARDRDKLVAYQFFFYVLRHLPPTATQVQLTLDRQVQKMALEQVRVVIGTLQGYHVTNAAVIILDNHARQVLAYVGSASFFDVQHSGQVDGVQALRQPGSSLKPFIYALALERGFTPATVLPDVPTSYLLGHGFVYSPENYSNTFHGPVSLRVALANSFNVPACRTAARVGVPAVLRQLHRFGFVSLDRNADYYGLGVVLGGGEVRLYESARAYMALADEGLLVEPAVVLRVNGKPVRSTIAPKRVCDPVTAYLITDILSDRYVRRLAFGTHSVLDLPFPCAAKTGTSSGRRDNWTLGYTRDFTVGVWVGNFDGSAMQGVCGLTGAGPLFARIMYHLYCNREPPKPPRRPPGIVTRPVCSLSGRRPGPHCPCVREELLPVSALPDYASHHCTWHRRVDIDLRTGFPAASDCPPSYRRREVRAVVPETFRAVKQPEENSTEPGSPPPSGQTGSPSSGRLRSAREESRSSAVRRG